MCGIAGFITFNPGWQQAELGQLCGNMTQRLSHRGPDDSGFWTDATVGIALGQRRLSILDLSQNGHQPMLSHDGRYVMVLNGEIYNHQELRKELEGQGYRFRGTSDTEVAVCAVQKWGFITALTRFIGMFAIGVWDRQSQKLLIARDRLGEKPLYYGGFGTTFAFASELKALTAHPHWIGEQDPDAIALLLKYTYIPAPRSIYKGIYKLLPGTLLEISTRSNPGPAQAECYWSLDQVIHKATLSKGHNPEPEGVVESLHDLLLQTIGDKMIADVPLGAFLSGGIDSSLIVALMQARSNRPVKTFSIGFNEPEFNEAGHAKAVASHLGTEHTELYVSAEESLAVIPRLPDIYDEPFADSSQIPTFLVSQLARSQVTVALSGDGGDELFGGYTRYLTGMELWSKIKRIPRPLRHLGGKMIHSVRPAMLDQLARPFLPLLPPALRYKQFGHKLHKLADVWNAESPDAIYNSLICLWQDPVNVVRGARAIDILERHQGTTGKLDKFTERMMYLDTLTYLPDDILAKVDRASMAVSLEVRVPFLDHRIVEFAWQQPSTLKIKGNEGKWLLRRVLERYVPTTLTDRPKMGFGVPLDSWLRGPLKEWAGDLLAEDRLRRQGIMDPVPVQEKWRQHLSGEMSWHYQLWPILMYQAWHDRWIK
jgi:asparagine synthase (glutamine-hydrolysing)